MNLKRMTLSRIVVALTIAAAVSLSAAAQSVDQAALDAVMNDAMKYWQTPGSAVVVVRGDEVVYLKGFGVSDVGSKRPVTPDTIFAIGSTTKAFVTAAMAIQADEGKMSWDDPVRK